MGHSLYHSDPYYVHKSCRRNFELGETVRFLCSLDLKPENEMIPTKYKV